MSQFPIDADGVVKIDTERGEKLLASETTSAHVKAILTALRDYGIGWFWLSQTKEPIASEILEAAKAYIAVVSDDTDCAKGPDAFDPTTLKRLITTSTTVSIMSCDFITSIYSMLATMSGLLQTGTTVIETRPEMEAAWIEYVRSVSETVPIILCTSKNFGGAA
jgi:hypothetical protein